MFENPITELLSFFGSIVLVRDHEICDLEPDVSFILKPLEGIEHRVEVRKCNLVVETLCKGFEIHVGCVDVTKNLRPCLRRDVARGDHDALQTLFSSKTGNINNKFPPDHRIVISKRNTRNLVLHCQLHDFFWAGTQTMRFVELRLADAPVLTKAATEIATRSTKAQHTGPGQKMIQGLFFDGIDREPGGCAVAEGIEFAADVLADVAETGLVFAQATEAWTEGAENLPVVFCLPPESLFHGQTIPLFPMPGKWQTKRCVTFIAPCDIVCT